MTSQKFATGAFVFTRARGLQPHLPKDLEPLAAQHDIDPANIPSYAGDRIAIGRAITQASAGLHHEGYLLRPIKRTSTEVTYGIISEKKDESAERLNHDFEATIAWAAEPDPSVITGHHPITLRVAEAYGVLRGKVTSDDWSSVITSFLESHDAARVRSDGRIYRPLPRWPSVPKGSSVSTRP